MLDSESRNFKRPKRSFAESPVSCSVHKETKDDGMTSIFPDFAAPGRLPFGGPLPRAACGYACYSWPRSQHDLISWSPTDKLLTKLNYGTDLIPGSPPHASIMLASDSLVKADF